MTPQKFYDNRLPLAPIAFIGLITILALCIFVGISGKIWEESVLLTIEVLLIILLCIYACIKCILEVFPTLWIYQDIGKIVWKFGAFRKFEVNFAEYLFVSVQEVSALRGCLPPKMVNEVAYYICFSTLPIDPKYSRKITKLRVKEGFIRFTYSDKLALTLMDVLPKERTVQLKTFFDYMQTKKRTSKK